MKNSRPENSKVNHGAVHEKFYRLVKLYEKMERSPRSFGTDETFTSSEIHLIEMIGDNNEKLGVTDLANLLGITKGAVSQNLKKLDKRGLTDKEEDPENSSRSIVKLTSKGKSVFFAHRHWHETMDGGFKSFLTGLEEERILFLIGFMSKVESFFQSILESGD